MTPPPTADTEVPAATTSWILGAIHTLPPWAQLLAFVLPLVVFVSWGPWSWVSGGIAGVWAATWGGVDALLVLGMGVGLAVYVVNCRWNPYADCRWCKGSPRRRDSRKNYHFCFWCGGNGRRTRLGAHAWSRYRESSA